MAWFNNKTIYDTLIQRKKAGVTIEIALDDNNLNHNAEFDMEADFPVYWITVESKNPKLLPQKFCIIDLKTLIHGTFNWKYA